MERRPSGLYLAGWLLYVQRSQRRLRLPKNTSMLSLAVIALFYLISSLWTVDRRMAFFGFIKALPLAIPLFSVYQFDRVPIRTSFSKRFL